MAIYACSLNSEARSLYLRECECKSYHAYTMIEYKAEHILTEPKIYAIALHASNNGNVLIWNCVIAAYTPETANSEALADLREKNAELYNNGIKLGGWRMQNYIELTGAKIDSMLTAAEGAMEDMEIERDKQERNTLMQTIVDTASRKLLNKYKDRFTTSELGYLEDEIVKYEQQR